jgi:hypothetical protein
MLKVKWWNWKKIKEKKDKNKRKKNRREICFTIHIRLICIRKKIQINIGVGELKYYFSEEDSALMKCYYEKKTQI